MVKGPLLPRLLGVLDDAERERAARFLFDEDRVAYVAAHGLLRVLLSRVGGGKPSLLRFEMGPWGKPALAMPAAQGPMWPSFNLAHCRTMVCVALGPAGVDIGVDVEPQGRGLAIEPDVAHLNFSGIEREQLTGLQGEPQQWGSHFMQLWTLKEAVIKASGRGLHQPLQGFSVAPPRSGTGPAIYMPHDGLSEQMSGIHLYQWLEDGHLWALGWHGASDQPNLVPVSGDDLWRWLDDAAQMGAAIYPQRS